MTTMWGLGVTSLGALLYLVPQGLTEVLGPIVVHRKLNLLE